MERLDSGLTHQSLPQEVAEAGRMRDRQSDVFIKMEQLNPHPVDIGLDDQGIEKFELRCPSGGNHAGASVILNRASNRGRGLFRGCLAQRLLVRKYLDHHTAEAQGLYKSMQAIRGSQRSPIVGPPILGI